MIALAAALQGLLAVLDRLEIPFFAGGTVASGTHGLPRWRHIEFRVASAEDTILAKLVWFRRGGEASDRQWHDVLGVIQVQADRLDSAYMREWAAHLGVADLLVKALG